MRVYRSFHPLAINVSEFKSKYSPGNKEDGLEKINLWKIQY